MSEDVSGRVRGDRHSVEIKISIGKVGPLQLVPGAPAQEDAVGAFGPHSLEEFLESPGFSLGVFFCALDLCFQIGIGAQAKARGGGSARAEEEERQ